MTKDTAFSIDSNDTAPGGRDTPFDNVHEVVSHVEAPKEKDSNGAKDEPEVTKLTLVVPDYNRVKCSNGIYTK